MRREQSASGGRGGVAEGPFADLHECSPELSLRADPSGCLVIWFSGFHLLPLTQVWLITTLYIILTPLISRMISDRHSRSSSSASSGVSTISLAALPVPP